MITRQRSPRPWTREVSENEQRRDAHEYLYTPDTLNTGMYTKSRMNLNHRRRRRCARRHHRNASLIFPNAERNCRDHKLPFNDRAPGLTSIRSEAIHRGPFSPSILNYARKGSAIINFWHVRAKRGRLSPRRTQSAVPSPKLRARDVIEGAPPLRCTNTGTRVRCRLELSALSRY